MQTAQILAALFFNRVSVMLTQRVHLQLLPQANLLQAVIEVGLRAAADGGRQREDAHDLPLVSIE